MNMLSKPRLLRWRAELQLTVALLLSMLILLFPGIGAEAAFAADGPPAAVGKNVTTAEDTPITIDTGIAFDSLYEVKQTNAGPASPAHGTMSAGPTVGGKYTINYTPGPNRVDAVNFEYHLCMTIPPNSCGSAATVNVTITPVNDAPTADNDAATTPEDTAISIDVLDGDSAGPADENQSLTIVDLQNPTTQGGTVVVAAGKVTYTPPVDFCNVDTNTFDTFQYRAQDTAGLKSGDQSPNPPTYATVTVDVTCVNDKPKANADSFTVQEDSNPVSDFENTFAVLQNDSPGPNALPYPGSEGNTGENQQLTIISVEQPVNGEVAIVANQIIYTPDLNYCNDNTNPIAPDTFTYQIQDNGSPAKKDKGTVEVTVECVVDKPLLSIENIGNVDDHMFTADVVLTSPDKDVSGVNFDLDYDCLLNPIADANTTPPVPPFFVDIQDDGNKLGFLIGDQSGNGAVLAGPSASAQRTLATVKFTVDPASICIANNPVLVDLLFNNAKFSGPNSQLIPGGGLTEDLVDEPIDANEPPGATTLSPNSVPEKVASAFVGFLSTTDPDIGDIHSYSIVGANKCNNIVPPPTPAAEANTLFQVVNNPNSNSYYVKLQNGKSTDFVAKQVHHICVESMDNYSAKSYTVITINVAQGNLAPVAVNDGMLDDPNVTIDPGPITVKGATDIDVLANDVDPNGNNTIAVDATTNGAHGMVINNGTDVTFVATDALYRGNDIFNYTIKDNGGLTDNADVTVKIQQDKAPGNCNGQGGLDAGDLTAWGLEFFDGDDNTKWYLTPNRIGGGTFDGSPYGCNANKNAEIDAGDLTCIGILYFNGVCNPAVLAASSQTTASLAVSSDLVAAPGASVSVPINLSSAGNAVAAAAFAVDFDDAVLSFDATDANADGIPDAVSLNIPSGLFTMVSYNATESRIEIIVSGMAPPFPLLSDGVLATITLTAGANTNGTQSAIQLTNSSLGNDEGMPVPVDVTDGLLQVNVEGQSQLNNFLYLPTIQR